ncbi:MAG: circularly permuted type 2 ATP-grasp protein [Desulfococcaceae bacterium]
MCPPEPMTQSQSQGGGPPGPAPPSPAVICHSYAVPPEGYDEMWDESGRLREHWRPFVDAVEALGCEEMERAEVEVTRLLRENGIAYNLHGSPQGVHRNWKLDTVPLIFGAEDWKHIEAGLRQRALLMDQILADLYGPRHLIREGLLPQELIYRHPGFLRPCFDAGPAENNQLLLHSADLARGPDNRFWVISDLTRNAVGLGYALENRTAMANVLPDLIRSCRVRRLSSFFRGLRAELAAMAPHKKDRPRIVILSGGPQDESYFEHAYLAAYLGYPLVQGDDLTVRDARVWLKSLDGLHLVDVILRQVDDPLCDPLELAPDSRRGVPGLLEAARRGNVALVNPLGVGVLENPGLMAFLPGISRHLLGEELLLPSAATWWCGQPKERDYVLENLERLIVKTICHVPGGGGLVFGSLLSREEREVWRERIRATPHRYVGQQQMAFSTVPTLPGGRMEPRPAVFRTFAAVRAEGDYVVMPGAIARCGSDQASSVVSRRTGGILKDGWVIATRPEVHMSLWLQPGRPGQHFAGASVLPSRVAENLFWVGRYAERAEALARILRTVLRLVSESDRYGEEAEAEALTLLESHLVRLALGRNAAAAKVGRSGRLGAVLGDPEHPGSLYATLGGMLNAAYAVRDHWSTDTWRVINRIEALRNGLNGLGVGVPRVVVRSLDDLITTLMALTGLCMENMSREAGWLLLDTGRRIERALMFISFCRAHLTPKLEPTVSNLLLEAVLVTTENIITYRRRYRSYLELETVLDLLLLDANNPRSLVYQLNRLKDHIDGLPREREAYRLSDEERMIQKATTRLRLANTAHLSEVVAKAGCRQRLDGLLSSLKVLLTRIAEALSGTYFSHTPESRQLVGPARENRS